MICVLLSLSCLELCREKHYGEALKNMPFKELKFEGVMVGDLNLRLCDSKLDLDPQQREKDGSI
jgi:hypothetical protein